MPPEDDPIQSTRMSLGEHLDELRRRLMRGILAVLISFFVGFYFYDETTEIVMRPMQQSLGWLDQDQVEKFEAVLEADPSLPRSTYFQSDDPAETLLKPEFTVSQRPQALSYAEPFWFAIKVTLIFALFIGAPVLLWQMWQFIAAGLYTNERRIVLSYFPVSILLFLAGTAFGFFVMVPYGFYFLAGTFPAEKVAFVPRISDYLSLLTSLTLALGAVFQLPLLMHVLVRLDLVQRETFSTYRTHFIVGAFVVGAMLTPPDPYTQALLAGPMIILFEIGLLSTRMIKRPQALATTPPAEDAT
jgi:sec-independent protein translocase protein TatC